LGIDLLRHIRERAQLVGQRVDAAHAVLFKVAVVRNCATHVRDAILCKQQLELFVVAKGVGRTHECRKRGALAGQIRSQRCLLVFEPGQLFLLRCYRGLGVMQRTRCLPNTVIGLAQRLARIATLTFGIALLRPQCIELRAQIVQLALCVGFLLFIGPFLGLGLVLGLDLFRLRCLARCVLGFGQRRGGGSIPRCATHRKRSHQSEHELFHPKRTSD
jgi:hypothetical protein